MAIAETAKILPPSDIKNGLSCGDFTLIGVQPEGSDKPLPGTIIAENATIRSHVVIYAGNKIGRNFQTGHGAMVREFNEIGDNVSIGTHSIVEHHVIIGNGVRLHSNVFVPEYTVIEDDVWIGPGVIVTNAKYPNTKGAKTSLVGPTIRRGAVIGAGAILLPGITVGYGAMIGAGAIVTRDVEDGQVVVGDAAQVNAASRARVEKARDTK